MKEQLRLFCVKSHLVICVVAAAKRELMITGKRKLKEHVIQTENCILDTFCASKFFNSYVTLRFLTKKKRKFSDVINRAKNTEGSGKLDLKRPRAVMLTAKFLLTHVAFILDAAFLTF